MTKPKSAQARQKTLKRQGLLGSVATVALVVAAAQTGGVVLGGSAQAQEGDVRGLPVFDRARPDFDPVGISAGGFFVYPFAELSGTYEDNIFATEDDEESDFITRIRPGVRAESKWSRHSLDLGASARFNQFADNDDESTEEYDVNGNLLLDISRQADLEFGASYRRITVDRSDPEEAGRDEPEEFDQIAGSVAGTYQFNRFAVRLSGEARELEFLSDEDEDSNRTEYQTAARLSYIFSPNIQAFVEPFYRVRDFDNDVDAFGVDRDSDVSGAFAGVAYDLTGIIVGDTSVGFYTTDFEDDRFDSEDGFAVRSRTVWNVTGRTSLIGNVSRENEITNEPNASSKTFTRAAVEAQHELRQNILVGGEVFYFQEDFVDGDRTDDNYGIGLEGEYLINRMASVTAGYEFRTRESDVDGAGFDRNRFMIGVRAQF